MKTLALLSALMFVSLTSTFAALPDKAKNKTCYVVAEEAKKATDHVATQEDEAELFSEIEHYYHDKYEKPIVEDIHIEKVEVYDAEGNLLMSANLPDHHAHEVDLPVGAEKLMEKGNTVYYIVLK